MCTGYTKYALNVSFVHGEVKQNMYLEHLRCPSRVELHLRRTFPPVCKVVVGHSFELRGRRPARGLPLYMAIVISD